MVIVPVIDTIIIYRFFLFTGTFGQVFKALNTSTGITVALKLVECTTISEIARAKHEVQVLQRVADSRKFTLRCTGMQVVDGWGAIELEYIETQPNSSV